MIFMRRLALQGSTRRLLTRLHRWSGLTVMALLTIAGLTGGVLVFRDALDRAVNPHLRVVTPGTQRASLQAVIDRVEQRFPDARVSIVTLQSTASDPLIMYLAKKPARLGGSAEPLQASEVFVNPYTGGILGQRGSSRVIASREYLIPLIVRLHYSLLLGTVGVWIMGISAIIWLLTSIVGLALAWPATWRSLTGWTGTLAVRRGEGAYKANYDVHRSLGVGLLPLWIVLAFTSVYLNFPNLVRLTTAMISPVTAMPLPAARPADYPIVTPEQAIHRALGSVPSARAFGLTRDFANGWYSVRLRLPGDVNLSGNSRAYVDFSSGEVKAVRLATAATAGQRFLFWQFPLHSGEAFGLPGRIVIGLAAVTLVVMCGTGFYVWLRGWTVRRRNARTARVGSAQIT